MAITIGCQIPVVCPLIINPFRVFVSNSCRRSSFAGGGSGAHSIPTDIRQIAAPQPPSATHRLRSANPASLLECDLSFSKGELALFPPSLPKRETAVGFLLAVYDAGALHHGTSIYL